MTSLGFYGIEVQRDSAQTNMQKKKTTPNFPPIVMVEVTNKTPEDM